MNIRIGPIIQFCISESASTRQLRKNSAQFLILDLGQRRVHHQDKTDGNRNIGRPNLELIPEVDHSREKVSPAHSDKHRKKDPQCQKPIHKREFFNNPVLQPFLYPPYSIYPVRNNASLGFESQRLEFLTGFIPIKREGHASFSQGEPWTNGRP